MYEIFKNFSATFASNGSFIEWKIALHKKRFLADQAIEKIPISDILSQFSMSKIIRIFLNMT